MNPTVKLSPNSSKKPVESTIVNPFDKMKKNVIRFI
jgi:hypothetical protein